MEKQELVDFIKDHLYDDPVSLRLSKHKFKGSIDLEFAITQIRARRKFNKKLSRLIDNSAFLFPDLLSGEQASHQAVAIFHASLLQDAKNIIDLTSGLGIDTFAFASIDGTTIKALDIIAEKTKVLKENALSLGLQNIEAINQEAFSYINNNNNSFDLIFVDPARRDASKNRVYNLLDCSPDVISFQDILLSRASRVLIKASPLLDITRTLKDFKNIASIRTVGVKGECKEVLIELSNNTGSSILLEAVNLDNEGNILSKFSITPEEVSSQPRYIKNRTEIFEDSKQELYLLEPSAMVMKLAPWSKISEEFNALKFDKSSHLFVSGTKPSNFPGRVTRIIRQIKKSDWKSFAGFPASVVSKNHPLSSEEIRKSLKLKEGDNNFIYASRIDSKNIILLSEVC